MYFSWDFATTLTCLGRFRCRRIRKTLYCGIKLRKILGTARRRQRHGRCRRRTRSGAVMKETPSALAWQTVRDALRDVPILKPIQWPQRNSKIAFNLARVGTPATREARSTSPPRRQGRRARCAWRRKRVAATQRHESIFTGARKPAA